MQTIVESILIKLTTKLNCICIVLRLSNNCY